MPIVIDVDPIALHVDAGLRRYEASLDGKRATGDNTPREYASTAHRIGR